jgi:hypothetical protein
MKKKSFLRKLINKIKIFLLHTLKLKTAVLYYLSNKYMPTNSIFVSKLQKG